MGLSNSELLVRDVVKGENVDVTAYWPKLGRARSMVMNLGYFVLSQAFIAFPPLARLLAFLTGAH